MCLCLSSLWFLWHEAFALDFDFRDPHSRAHSRVSVGDCRTSSRVARRYYSDDERLAAAVRCAQMQSATH